ncbi:MAG: cupin domain-containing protein [Simkaniaceae bacterium]
MKIVAAIIKENGPFPNNPNLPLLHYQRVLEKLRPEEVQEKFAENNWKNSWINGIYPYHHFHSNTHEALGVVSGSCQVQVGGENGRIFEISAGDVLVIPAGVSHKNIGSSPDFLCVGCYPLEIPYDMHEGKQTERPGVDENIANVPHPKKDPVFGEKGPLLEHWRS